MFSPAKERLLEELNYLEDTLVAFQAFLVETRTKLLKAPSTNFSSRYKKMNKKDRTKTLGMPTIQCLVFPDNKKHPRRLVRELVEQEVGPTPQAFWSSLAGRTKTTYKTFCERQAYTCQARLVYHSQTLWILEGATKGREGQACKDPEAWKTWTLEVHKPSQKGEDTFVWIYGMENINGAL